MLWPAPMPAKGDLAPFRGGILSLCARFAMVHTIRVEEAICVAGVWWCSRVKVDERADEELLLGRRLVRSGHVGCRMVDMQTQYRLRSEQKQEV